ncbi:MAG: zinc dependent phospholipase C family protein [Adhaeribacter sp.]
MRTCLRPFAVFFLLLVFLLLGGRQPAAAYSVLTHQALIDVAWEPALLPLLKKRYPRASAQDLRKAHAFAYGGAIIQDMGYYPLGSKFFTDLTHYVRTGDFVTNMIREARSLEEYAFALGALSHYYSDNVGHAQATNKAVPLVYPELKAEFGPVVTYEQDPVSHIKMEFGFDVLQVARGHYAPEAYHDFIGFEVSKDVLERAFAKTYGLELRKQFVSLELAIGTYRRTVSTLIPDLTRAAWRMKKSEIQEARPGLTRRKFEYRIRRAAYHQHWGHTYQRPNLWENFLSWLFRVLPRLGPNRALAFKPPTPEAEKLFMQSFTAIADQYQAGLKAVGNQSLDLVNTDFDTGRRTARGDYRKADTAYAELLEKLAKEDFKNLSPALKQHILLYYQTFQAGEAARKENEKELQTRQALQQLRDTKR